MTELEAAKAECRSLRNAVVSADERAEKAEADRDAAKRELAEAEKTRDQLYDALEIGIEKLDRAATAEQKRAEAAEALLAMRDRQLVDVLRERDAAILVRNMALAALRSIKSSLDRELPELEGMLKR